MTTPQISLPPDRPMNGHASLGDLMDAESQRQLETSGAAVQPLFSQAEIEQLNFRRFNPYASLTAASLSSAIDRYEAGDIMTLARFCARIAKSDPTIVTVKSKREEAVSLRPISTRPLDDSPAAADQAFALDSFYRNVRATHSTKRHVRGKSSLLLEQMMESVAFEYAVHHIVFEPNAAQTVTLPSGTQVPSLGAIFEYVPLEYFEARTGVLRFLGLNNFYIGEPLEKFGQWLITTGPGLMFAGCILHYFKRLALHDLVNFSEKFGQPGTLVHTTAQQNSPEGKSALALAQNLASNYRGVLYGAPENKAEYLWPQGGASTEGLPMHVLIRDLKQDLISMWMGADLSTMSRGGGKDSSQPVIGASVQGEDQEKKEKRDCARMGETLNAQVDPIVLRWFFGQATPILAESFIDYPNNEDRKDLRDSVTMIVQGGGEVPLEPIAKRLNVPLAKEGEKTFEKAVPAAPGGDGGPFPPKKPAVNVRAGADPDLENFLGPLVPDFRKALANDLQPFRNALEAVLNQDDGVAFNTKLAWLKGQLPSLLKEIAAAPASAQVLAKILQKSFDRGFSEAAQTRSTAELAATTR